VTRTRPESAILGSFGALLAAQVVGAGLGLVFWVTVARVLSPGVVGTAAAAISTQTILGSLASLGVGTLLIRELPLLAPAAQRRLVVRGLAVVTLVSLAAGTVVGLVSGFLGPALRAALSSPTESAVFAVGVAGAGCALVVDQAGLGLRKARLQVGRSLLASGLRFPVVAALLWFDHRDALALQLAWVLPLWFSIVVSLARLRLGRNAHGADDRPTRPMGSAAHYAGSALRNHALSMALAAGTQLVPVIAALTLTSVDNAAFAVAWLLASFVFLPPYLMATALFAHGANTSADEFRDSMRSTLPAAFCLSLALCVGAWVLARPVLAVFGSHYVDNSATLLAIVAPVGLWMVVKDHLVAFFRSQDQFKLGVCLTLVSVAMELTGAAVGAVVAGPVGLCAGWLIAAALEVPVYLPWLRRVLGGLAWRSPLSLMGRRG
jgi:O-antigen/teichoic acid export membrane protein